MSDLGDFLVREVPRLASALRGSGNEPTFRQRFLEGLSQALTSEGFFPDIRLEESGLAGRTDARVEHFIFEFKSPGELSKRGPRERGLSKLKDYLSSRPTEEHSRTAGLLTDGFQSALLVYNRGTKDFSYVDSAEVATPTGTEVCDWTNFTLPLERLIRGMARPHLNDRTLLSRFGLSTSIAQSTLRALWKQLNAGDSEFTKLLFGQWRELFALAVEFSVTDEPGEDLVELFQMGGRVRGPDAWDEAVFVVHTYYSLLLKLLAIRIVDELGLAGRVSLMERVIESPVAGMRFVEGEIPRLLGNVIERDVFSWPYADEEMPPTADVVAAIAEMAKRIGSFDVKGVRTDVLRRVYQNLIPSKLRKSLGEFYTPTWAADLILDKVAYGGDHRLLDPTCGSGTFLVAAIGRARIANRAARPAERVKTVTDTIVGYDLNPIAVSTSRLNYVLGLVDDLVLEPLRTPLVIPVYLCDSLLIPEVESRGLAPYFEIPTRVGIVKVPILGNSPKSESEQMADTRRLIALLRENYTGELGEFLQAVRREFGANAEEDNRGLLTELHRLLHGLHVQHRDGIWTSIIENFFAPTLQGKFDFVVGNPPWVIPRRTPKNYTENVRRAVAKSAIDSRVITPATRDFLALTSRSSAAEQQYFACVPFVWRSLRRYVTDGGTVAFLMTSSMFTVIGSGGWRSWVSRFEVPEILDMSLITDIHEGALCWSFVPVIRNVQRNADSIPTSFSFAVPGRPIDPPDPDLGSSQLAWSRWRVDLREVPVSKSRSLPSATGPVSPDSPWLIAPPDVISIVHRMQSFAAKHNNGPARLGDLYPMGMGFKADGWRYFAFDGVPEKGPSGEARGINLAGESISVESTLVFPVAVARGLRVWGFTPKYAFLPLNEAGESLSENELRGLPLAWEYLMNHKRALSARQVVKQGYVDNWFGILVPRAAVSGSKVAYRLIAERLEASLLPRTSKFAGRTSLLLPDQSVRFIPSKSLEEAAFLTAIMNSTPFRVVAYMCANPKGGVPYRQFPAWNVGFAPMLRWSPSDRQSVHVSELGLELARDLDAAERRQAALDDAVAPLLGLTRADITRLSKHSKLLTGTGHVRRQESEPTEHEEPEDSP